MYSHNNNYPVDNLPHSIFLPNGMTKTDCTTFTPEEIAYAGYRFVENPPEYDILRQRVVWAMDENNIADWKIVQIPDEEKWKEVRAHRDQLMKDFEWRISRYNREVTIGLPISDSNIQGMHTYMQELADITKQEDPFSIMWPQYYTSE